MASYINFKAIGELFRKKSLVGNIWGKLLFPKESNPYIYNFLPNLEKKNLISD
jgi:hypothetical protein